MDVLALAVDETDGRWVAAWSAVLDAGERGRADRFRRDGDRIRFLAAHALLRTVLGAATGTEPRALALANGPFGKPFIPGVPEVHFSLTHTAGLALVALHDAPVGCDAEPAARQVDEGVFSMLAPEERAWLLGLPSGAARQSAFIRLWTVKEAYAKALGLGLSLNPRTYAFDLSGDAVILRRAPEGRAGALGWDVSTAVYGADHVVALAVPAGRGPGRPPCVRAVSGAAVADAASGGTGLALSGWPR